MRDLSTHPTQIAGAWLAHFASALESNDVDAAIAHCGHVASEMIALDDDIAYASARREAPMGRSYHRSSDDLLGPDTLGRPVARRDFHMLQASQAACGSTTKIAK